MNRIFIIILVFVFCATSQLTAQKKSAGAAMAPNMSKQEYSQHKQNVYKQALKYADLLTATNAVHDILSLEPAATNWRDTLALLYLNQQSFYSSVSVSQEALKENPENMFMREISAYSYQGLGALKQALEDYEKLYAKSQNIQHIYQMATLQYNLGRVAECVGSLDQTAAHKDLAQSEVSLTYGNQAQKVPMNAAILNLKGVLAKDLNKNDEALKMFEEALQAFPDFVLAKGNIEAIKNPKKK